MLNLLLVHHQRDNHLLPQAAMLYMLRRAFEKTYVCSLDSVDCKFVSFIYLFRNVREMDGMGDRGDGSQKQQSSASFALFDLRPPPSYPLVLPPQPASHSFHAGGGGGEDTSK
jgi:hypothetical protein